MKKSLNKFLSLAVLLALMIFINLNVFAQIAANAIDADPSAKAISQQPLNPSIAGTTVLRFKFTNENHRPIPAPGKYRPTACGSPFLFRGNLLTLL